MKNKIKILQAEIARLKAELEKKVEVVRCGECKNWHPIELLENNYSIMKPQGPCMIRKDNTYFYEDDFCSHGTRKEAKDENHNELNKIKESLFTEENKDVS